MQGVGNKCSGESTCLPPPWLRFDSCGLSLLLVLILALRVFLQVILFSWLHKSSPGMSTAKSPKWNNFMNECKLWDEFGPQGFLLRLPLLG